MSLQCLGHKFHTSKTLRFGSSWSRFSLFWRVSKCSRRIRSCWACSASAWKTTKFLVFRLKFLKNHVDAARKSKRWQKGRVTWRLFFSFGPSWLQIWNFRHIPWRFERNLVPSSGSSDLTIWACFKMTKITGTRDATSIHFDSVRCVTVWVNMARGVWECEAIPFNSNFNLKKILKFHQKFSGFQSYHQPSSASLCIWPVVLWLLPRFGCSWFAPPTATVALLLVDPHHHWNQRNPRNWKRIRKRNWNQTPTWAREIDNEIGRCIYIYIHMYVFLLISYSHISIIHVYYIHLLTIHVSFMYLRCVWDELDWIGSNLRTDVVLVRNIRSKMILIRLDLHTCQKVPMHRQKSRRQMTSTFGLQMFWAPFADENGDQKQRRPFLSFLSGSRLTTS